MSVFLYDLYAFITNINNQTKPFMLFSLSPHLSLALQVLESTKVNAIHKDHQVPSFIPRWDQSCFSLGFSVK